jgi:hypothetical protein
VISVYAKKTLLGRLPAAGWEWRPKGDPVHVEDHSFVSVGPEMPRAMTCGVYDLGADPGWVNVGSTTTPERSTSPRSGVDRRPRRARPRGREQAVGHR